MYFHGNYCYYSLNCSSQISLQINNTVKSKMAAVPNNAHATRCGHVISIRAANLNVIYMSDKSLLEIFQTRFRTEIE